MSNIKDESIHVLTIRNGIEVKKKKEIIFEGALIQANRVTKNNTMYSEKCLQKINDDFKKTKKPEFGVFFDSSFPTVVTSPFHKAAFIPEEMRIEKDVLILRSKTINTPPGNVLRDEILDKGLASKYSVGIAGTVEPEDKKEIDGVIYVDKINVTRFSILPLKEKGISPKILIEKNDNIGDDDES